ncbi:MAG: hypothetical protein JWN79_2391 [Gemmatimonadetes bacterium]|nr:hypothetical protein [Gemmatimonadota bacterium]
MANARGGDDAGTRGAEPMDSGRGGHDVNADAARAAADVASRAPGNDDMSVAHSGEAAESGAERARRKEAELIGE